MAKSLLSVAAYMYFPQQRNDGLFSSKRALARGTQPRFQPATEFLLTFIDPPSRSRI